MRQQMTAVVHSPAWLQLPLLRPGQAGAAAQESLLLLALCARRAVWKQWVIEEVFSQISPSKYMSELPLLNITGQ